MRFNFNKTVLLTGLLGLMATTVNATTDSWANARYYDMYDHNGDNIKYGATPDSYEHVDITDNDGVYINDVFIEVSGWSDTGGHNDELVEQAYFGSNARWYSSYTNATGYGMYNADESNGERNGGSDPHAIDNMGYWYDTDMVLFSFSEEVSLDSAQFSYALNSGNDQEVSILGLSSIDGLTGGNSTWTQIANNYGVAGTAGSFSIDMNNGIYNSSFTTTDTAKYWLVGAYNSAFAYVDNFTDRNDAFKIASIGFSKVASDPNNTPDPVNAPSSFAFFLLAGGFAAWRKKQAK